MPRTNRRPAARHRRRLSARTRRLVGGFATVALTLSVAFAVRTGDAAVTPAAPPSPGRFTGSAFDACTAPTSAAMDAWLASPYRAVGIYFGGVNRGCAQPNLNAAWVARQQSKGWKMIPLYVGLQAPCRATTKPKIVPAQAAAQGTGEADTAAAQAAATGLGKGSVLIFDMEAYPVPDAACTAAVQSFMSAWTVRLHQLGYFSGFYSSMSSGVTDMVAIYNRDGYARPDFLDFARWDNVDTLTDVVIPDSYWTPGRRMKQYKGGHNETWGGVTINVDTNYVDFLPAVTTPFADSSGDGWADVVARDANGDLFLYPGDGTDLLPRVKIGHGWNSMSEIVRLGDFDRKGYEDIAARHTNGYLFNYPGRAGGGFQAGVVIGTGWQNMREITSIGDLNRDGYRDVLAIGSTGNLNFYLGRGFRLASGGVASTGWSDFDNLTGGGDVDGDGYPDLVARQRSTGDLYLSLGKSGGLQDPVLLATGWQRMREITMVGDFDRDAFPDLVAIDTADGKLYRYPFNPDGTLGNRYTLSAGWATRSPVT